METRPFGREATPVSEVGLGTWQIGGQWGSLDEETAYDILAAAADCGVDFFDTADVYGLGRSETLLGRFLRDRRAPAFVATKVGRLPEPGWPENFTPDVLRRHTENSLERLGVDALDLTQLHCLPRDELARGHLFETLDRLQEDGLIRRWGASVESIEEASLCLEQPGLASLQIIFNIFRQTPLEKLLERARRQGVAVIVRLPLASGLLAGRYDPTTSFPEDDHRRFNADGQAFNVGETFGGLPFQTGLELVEGLRPQVPDGMTMAEMALRWVLDHDAVTTVIPGARTPAQAVANALVSDLKPLSRTLHDAFATYWRDRVHPHVRGPD